MPGKDKARQLAPDLVISDLGYVEQGTSGQFLKNPGLNGNAVKRPVMREEPERTSVQQVKGRKKGSGVF